MFLPRLLLSGLLLGPAFAGLAQTATSLPPSSAPAPRLYVGLGTYGSYYHPLKPFANQPDRGVRVPVQLTAGYQWRPRWALQASLAYSGWSERYAYAGYYYPGTGGDQLVYYSSRGTLTARAASAALLGRYTLTRQPAHRVQFDLLGGLTLEHSRYRERGTSADSARVPFGPTPFDTRDRRTSLLFTFGSGVRYRLGSRFELLYDFTLNTRLTSNRQYFSTGPTTANTLGLRYRFGPR